MLLHVSDRLPTRFAEKTSSLNGRGTCVGLFLHSQFCSLDIYVYLYANTTVLIPACAFVGSLKLGSESSSFVSILFYSR